MKSGSMQRFHWDLGEQIIKRTKYHRVLNICQEPFSNLLTLHPFGRCHFLTPFLKSNRYLILNIFLLILKKKNKNIKKSYSSVDKQNNHSLKYPLFNKTQQFHFYNMFISIKTRKITCFSKWKIFDFSKCLSHAQSIT